tara:strand:- start:498 stop:755 length:258 start_codon:yes stop_codon:yes gene_type:complete
MFKTYKKEEHAPSFVHARIDPECVRGFSVCSIIIHFADLPGWSHWFYERVRNRARAGDNSFATCKWYYVGNYIVPSTLDYNIHHY